MNQNILIKQLLFRYACEFNSMPKRFIQNTSAIKAAHAYYNLDRDDLQIDRGTFVRALAIALQKIKEIN